jgi:hypothetical protein
LDAELHGRVEHQVGGKQRASASIPHTSEPAPNRRPALNRWPLHDDETRSLQVLDQARLATIADMSSSTLWTRLRPWKRSAKAKASATPSAAARHSGLESSDIKK